MQRTFLFCQYCDFYYFCSMSYR
ncbi:hypothetical protein FAP79_09000 [Morganella morganii]|nr:hypothetical protein [Morganella morganii]MDF2405430.1 hypothetical protein [Morganella morganii]